MRVGQNDNYETDSSGALRRYFSSICYLDLRSLAAFRIGIGLCMLWDLADRSRDLTIHYTEQGFHPISAVFLTFPQALWSLHWLNDCYYFQFFLFLIHVLCVLCFTAGIKTRLFTALSWVMLVSLQNRNELVNHGGDQVLRVLLFWSLFLPLGKCFSIDHARAPSNTADVPPCYSAWTIGFIFQVVIVYWMAVINRSDDSWWVEGSALQHVLNLDFLVTDFGRWLGTHHTFVTLLTNGTMCLELVGPGLLLIPTRTGVLRSLVVAIFCCFHLAITATLRIPFFSSVMVCSWLALLPPRSWRNKPLPTQCLVPYMAGRQAGSRTMKLERSLRCWDVLPHAIIGYFLSYQILVVCLLKHLFTPDPRVLQWLTVPARMVRMDQSWNLFAPGPLKEDFLLSVLGCLSDGTLIDLLRGSRVSGLDAIRWPSHPYRNERWLKLAVNLFTRRNQTFSSATSISLKLLGTALVRQWNSQHDSTMAVTKYWVVFSSEGKPLCSRCDLEHYEIVSQGTQG